MVEILAAAVVTAVIVLVSVWVGWVIAYRTAKEQPPVFFYRNAPEPGDVEADEGEFEQPRHHVEL